MQIRIRNWFVSKSFYFVLFTLEPNLKALEPRILAWTMAVSSAGAFMLMVADIVEIMAVIQSAVLQIEVIYINAIFKPNQVFLVSVCCNSTLSVFETQG